MEYMSTLVTFWPHFKSETFPCTKRVLLVLKGGWRRQPRHLRRDIETAVFTWALLCQVSEPQQEELKTEPTTLTRPCHPCSREPHSICFSWWRKKNTSKTNLHVASTGTNEEKTWDMYQSFFSHNGTASYHLLISKQTQKALVVVLSGHVTMYREIIHCFHSWLWHHIMCAVHRFDLKNSGKNPPN